MERFHNRMERFHNRMERFHNPVLKMENLLTNFRSNDILQTKGVELCLQNINGMPMS